MGVEELMPQLCFRMGQRVIERIDWAEEAKSCEVVIVDRDGRVVMTESGNCYDAISGGAVPGGQVYRSIRSIAASDRKKATNLLGGTESRK